jgi:hypothetical protein
MVFPLTSYLAANVVTAVDFSKHRTPRRSYNCRRQGSSDQILEISANFYHFKCPYRGACGLRSSEFCHRFLTPSVFKDKKRREKFMITGRKPMISGICAPIETKSGGTKSRCSQSCRRMFSGAYIYEVIWRQMLRNDPTQARDISSSTFSSAAAISERQSVARPKLKSKRLKIEFGF